MNAGVQRVLGVFAKEPRPGRVKRRLAAAIGAAAAARLYDAFLRDLLARLAPIEARRVVAFDPPAARNFFSSLCGDRFQLVEQAAGDLGTRMTDFFRAEFDRSASRVVLVGSDSPDLPLERIEQAFDALERRDVVLGPSEDGGYYLIGMRRMVADVFQGIEWSSAKVLAQSMHRLRAIAIEPATLEPWYDVDLPADVTRLSRAIEAVRRAGRDPGLRHTERLLRSQSGTRGSGAAI